MQKDTSQNEIFFALDIGTRSIMGILGEKENEKIKIKHVAVELHKKRAMYDGQVHDIQAVADTADIVKKRLEQESGLKLTEVAIAAAGRSLKTIQTNITKQLEKETLIDTQIVKNLEIEVLQEASNTLKENSNDNIAYYNVGHSIMTYKLDDYEIKNPVGHKGQKLSIDVIATFLPKIVIEALESVMKKIHLNVSYMTLEPIVALEVVIPENVRLLNIAMVDIGAGTSDIAITKDGTIVGYSMTSTAGDEITEALLQKYLLDFDTAEKLKCNLCKSSNQTFTDIVGIKTEISTQEILDEIQDSIELVAKNISESIIKTNGKPTSAVFLIGGASQTPNLAKMIANHLQLPQARVIIKSVEEIINIENDNPLLEGPQSVTPVGILACSIKNEKKDFVQIKINDKKIKLFRSSELKISDALILAGFNPRDLISRKGKSLLVKINGEKKIYNGSYGQESEIYLNNEKANLDSKISDNDTVNIKPATSGKDAKLTIKDIINENYIYINDVLTPYLCDIAINSISCNDLNKQLENGDNVEYDILDSLDKLKNYMSLSDDKKIYINGEVAKYDMFIKPNDNIIVQDDKKSKKDVKISENKQIESNFYNEIKVYCNGDLVLMKGNKKEFIFIDIFDFINFDRSRKKGKNLILKHNDMTAKFTSKLKDGDKIEIYWKN